MVSPATGPDQPQTRCRKQKLNLTQQTRDHRLQRGLKSTRLSFPALLSCCVGHKPFSGLSQGGVTKIHSTAIKHCILRAKCFQLIKSPAYNKSNPCLIQTQLKLKLSSSCLMQHFLKQQQQISWPKHGCQVIIPERIEEVWVWTPAPGLNNNCPFPTCKAAGLQGLARTRDTATKTRGPCQPSFLFLPPTISNQDLSRLWWSRTCMWFEQRNKVLSTDAMRAASLLDTRGLPALLGMEKWEGRHPEPSASRSQVTSFR